MTYEQWIKFEGWARCPQLWAHGISFYPLSDEQRRLFAEYEDMKAGRGWRGWLHKYLELSFLASMEMARRVTPLVSRQLGVRA